MKNSVLVIGASALDVVGHIKSQLHPGTSNPASIRVSYGGVARNVAENLARLGQPVHLITVVGIRQFGNDIVDYTQRSGVDVTNTIRTSSFPTGFYMALLDETNHLNYAVDDMRIIDALSPEYLKQKIELFESARMVFLDANLPVATIRTAFSLARKAGVLVCADPTSSTLATKLKKYLPRLHLITPNATEAGILTGSIFPVNDRKAAIEAARQLVNQGVDIAIVTLAEFGVCYATSETNGHIPAIRTRIVDPTGAGDAMTAAIIFGLLNELSVDDAIRLGVSAASLTLHSQGTVCADLTLEKLYDQLVA